MNYRRGEEVKSRSLRGGARVMVEGHRNQAPPPLIVEWGFILFFIT